MANGIITLTEMGLGADDLAAIGKLSEKGMTPEQIADAVEKVGQIKSSASEIDNVASASDLEKEDFLIVNTNEQIIFDISESADNEINSLQIKTCDISSSKIIFNTVAKGRTGSADVTVSGNGMTHPKMIYINSGWNGYEYWIAMTPYFGVVGPNSQYENPHVFASNDMITWVEPSGGRIDKPNDGDSDYLSDTHLMLGNDGFLYCFYRRSTATTREYLYKRSSDGITWSTRKLILNTTITAVSPTFENIGGGIQIYDLVKNGTDFTTTTSTSTEQHILRRYINNVSDSVGIATFETAQLCKYDSRPWGATEDPWHIDSIQVDNITIQLINTGVIATSTGNRLFIAYSFDGWNFKVVGEIENEGIAFYRSSLTFIKKEGKDIYLQGVLAKKDGILALYNIVLGE